MAVQVWEILHLDVWRRHIQMASPEGVCSRHALQALYGLRQVMREQFPDYDYALKNMPDEILM